MWFSQMLYSRSAERQVWWEGKWYGTRWSPSSSSIIVSDNLATCKIAWRFNVFLFSFCFFFFRRVYVLMIVLRTVCAYTSGFKYFKKQMIKKRSEGNVLIEQMKEKLVPNWRTHANEIDAYLLMIILSSRWFEIGRDPPFSAVLDSLIYCQVNFPELCSRRTWKDWTRCVSRSLSVPFFFLFPLPSELRKKVELIYLFDFFSCHFLRALNKMDRKKMGLPDVAGPFFFGFFTCLDACRKGTA